jgi:striatin 1/3/4
MRIDLMDDLKDLETAAGASGQTSNSMGASGAGGQGRGGASGLQYSIPGILHFLQHEWARFEMERGQWEVEKAELQVGHPSHRRRL